MLLRALLLFAFAVPSLADGREPGSVLVYPIHRSSLGFTVVSVTNTNTNPAGPGAPGGSTNALYQYLNTIPDPSSSAGVKDCYLMDRLEFLTPGDTLSVLTSCHNAADAEGYLVVSATSLYTGLGKDAISFNHLVGSELVINASGGMYLINAIPFESPLEEGLGTDIDADDQYDFDGLEYEGVPEELYLEFLALAGSSLTLINLSGGTQYEAVASFDVWNDNEQPLSATKLFRCWIEEPLADISPVFTDSYLRHNTPHDPQEVDLDCDGVGDVETGWARIRGLVANSSSETITNPAFLGAITAGPGSTTPGGRAAIDGGRLLWESAEKQVNGAFIHFGVTTQEPPVITSDGGGPTAVVTVAETTTAVTDVNSFDADGDTEGAGLAYSLTALAGGGIDNGFFALNTASGLLAFTGAPDFESPSDFDGDNDYQVQVTVTDSDGLTDTQDITVRVTNVNEAPVITSYGGLPTATDTIVENATNIENIESTDPDGTLEGAGGLTYSITGGADSALFGIQSTTGILVFNSARDFEDPQDVGGNNVYDVQVTVTDPGFLTDVVDIAVTVTDVNEAPVITSDGGGATASVDVAENTTAVTDVQSTDPEAETENGGGLTYSLTTTAGGGVDNAFFALDTATGLLIFTSPPDFENPLDVNADNNYGVQVTVTDSGLLTDLQDITVTVTNVNEAPLITSYGGLPTATDTILENATNVENIESIDPDGTLEGAGGLTYSVSGGADSALFSIQSTTGVLVFSNAVDFENPQDVGGNNVYEVQVTVIDPGLLADVVDIAVTVTDVNEAPVITSDGGGATASVDVVEYTTAVTDVQSTDPEGETENGGGLTYSLTTTAGGGGDNAFFSLDTLTGVLTFTAAPDFANPLDGNGDNDYGVQVTVTDSGLSTDLQDITVTVTNVNEAPVITSYGGLPTATDTILENATNIENIESTDPDGTLEGVGGLTYSISGGVDSAWFSIQSTTGILVFSNAPDFENPQDVDGNNVYDVQVTVTDPDLLTDMVDIAVTVTDVNEAPVITSDSGGATASVLVAENTAGVTDVQSTDPEGETENGGGLAYSLTTTAGGGADNVFFTLNTATGLLTFTSPPDFENPLDGNVDNNYEVQVTVTDSGGLTDEQDITVTVSDVPEAP